MLTDLQAGFRVGPDRPAATAALEGRLLPLMCADIDLIAAGRLRPKVILCGLHCLCWHADNVISIACCTPV